MGIETVRDFGKGILTELTIGSTHLTGSFYATLLMFLFEKNLGSVDAKGYFILGLIIMSTLFYFSSITMFAKEDNNIYGNYTYDNYFGNDEIQKLASGMVFSNFTNANYFMFIFGFTITYWGQLSVMTNSPTKHLSLLMYLGLAVVFVLYDVFLLRTHSWKSSFFSSLVGFLSGMIWCSIFHGAMTDLSDGTPSSQSSSNKQEKGTTVCNASSANGKNDDMVCQAFRVG